MQGSAPGQDKENDCVNQMVKHGFLPNRSGRVSGEDRFQSVSAKSAEADGQGAEKRGETEGRGVGHGILSQRRRESRGTQRVSKKWTPPWPSPLGGERESSR